MEEMIDIVIVIEITRDIIKILLIVDPAQGNTLNHPEKIGVDNLDSIDVG